MPYPCSPFCADIKSDIRFDNRFDTIKHIFGNKIYGMINMEAISKFDAKSAIDISTKQTTWIGHQSPSEMPIQCHCMLLGIQMV